MANNWFVFPFDQMNRSTPCRVSHFGLESEVFGLKFRYFVAKVGF